MPDNLSALVSGAGTAAPEKKKLKKVGDHWEDDSGNKFQDEEGNQPIKGEGEQAKAGAPSQSVMEPFGVEKATETAGWAPPQQSAMASGGMSQYAGKEGEVPKGMSEEDQQAAMAAYDVHVAGTDKSSWLKRWMTMSDEDKKKYKALADQKRGMQGA